MLFSTNEEINKNEELYGNKMKEKYLKKQKKKRKKMYVTLFTRTYIWFMFLAPHMPRVSSTAKSEQQISNDQILLTLIIAFSDYFLLLLFIIFQLLCFFLIPAI